MVKDIKETGILPYSPMFYKHFIRSPCRCCGSNDHGLLNLGTYKSKGVRYTKYTCPVLRIYPDPSILSEQEIYIQNHQACPIRLARQYKFNVEQIKRALNIYRTQGTGRQLTKQEYQIFQEDTLKQCHIYRKICHKTEEHKTLVIGDCIICGSQQHTTLKSHLTDTGSVIYNYSCPVSANGIMKGCQLESMSLKYTICPAKFANEYGYSFHAIHTALDTFRSSSASEHLSTLDIEKLESEVLDICERHQLETTISKQEDENHNLFQPTGSNPIQNLIHNLIQLIKHSQKFVQIQKLINTSDRTLTRLLIHNLVIGIICITLILSINGTLNPNHSS